MYDKSLKIKEVRMNMSNEETILLHNSLEIVCIRQLTFGDDTLYLARVQRHDGIADVVISKNAFDALNFLFRVDMCEDWDCKKFCV